MINKVLRDTARAPQPPTKQPAGHLISQQGLYVPNIFWAKNARLWAKHTNPARARAVIDRQWGLGENFLAHRLFFFFTKAQPRNEKSKN